MSARKIRGGMRVIPSTKKEANDFIREHHRHNGPVAGCRFCLALEHEGRVVGVAVVGRPVARALDERGTAEVTRCCVLDDAPKGACSKLYAACFRAWAAMGGTCMVTYTLDRESGASLRGAGWVPEASVRPGSWDRKGRRRRRQPVYGEPKTRWARRS